MGETLRLPIRIEGANEVLRNFRELERDATKDLRLKTLDVSKELANKIKAAAETDTRQSARAARSVKAVRDRVPAVQAGGTKASRPFLFGSEFGMTRKSGWYRKPRYFDSRGRQFRPHLGSHSYWFFKTAEDNKQWIESKWHEVADDVIERWRA